MTNNPAMKPVRSEPGDPAVAAEVRLAEVAGNGNAADAPPSPGRLTLLRGDDGLACMDEWCLPSEEDA